MIKYGPYNYLENIEDAHEVMMRLEDDHMGCGDRALYIGLDTETKPVDGHPKDDALRWWGKDPGFPFLYIIGWSTKLGMDPPVYYMIGEEFEWVFKKVVNYANQFTHKNPDPITGIKPIEWVFFNRTFDLGMVEFSKGFKIMGTTHEAFTAMRTGGFLPDWYDEKRLKFISEQFLDPRAAEPLDIMNQYKAEYENEKSKDLTAMLRAVKFTRKAYDHYLNEELPLPFHVKQVVEEWKKKWPELTYDKIPKEILLPYAGNDVRLTLWCFYEGMRLCKERSTMHIYEMEQELYLNNIREQTIIGWAVNREKLAEALPIGKARIAELTEYLKNALHYAECPTISADQRKKGFNPNSDDQIMKLFNYIGLFVPNLQAATLKRLIEVNGVRTQWADVIEKYESYKLYAKLVGTYIEPLLYWSQWDGRCHPSVRQDGAYTGRQSVVNPPLQTIPRKEVPEFNIRQFFYPRSNEYRLWMFDYSGMEVSVFAEYCRDSVMLDALHKGADFHSMLALKAFAPARGFISDVTKYMLKQGELTEQEVGDFLEVLHVEHMIYDHVLFAKIKHYFEHNSDMKKAWKKFKAFRQAAKTGMFAILYGAGPDALSEQMTKESEIYISRADASEFKTSFFSLYQGAKVFVDAVAELVSMRHALQEVYNHGRRYGWLRNLSGRLYLLEPRDSYKGPNYLVQGSCADILKKKTIKINKRFKELGVKSRVVLTIHDEVVAELHKNEERMLVPIIIEIMEDNPELEVVKLKAEPSFCPTNWASKKAFDGNWEEVA